MRTAKLIVLAALFLTIPATAFAMEQTVWNFRDSALPGEWKISGLDVPTTNPQGFRITASKEDGSLISEISMQHGAQVITFVTTSPVETQGQFLWHVPGSEQGVLVQLPFTIPVSDNPTEVNLNIDAYPQWTGQADEIGFTLPHGADVTIQEIRFTKWNIGEQAVEIWKSLWTFDKFSAFSINFIWGPVITFSPVETAALFTKLPPDGRSGNWIFYALFALLGIGCIAYRFLTEGEVPWIARLRRGRLSGTAMLFLLGSGAIWAVYDVRMGLELLSYTKNDYDTYISQPAGQKTLRTYLNFNDAMEQTLPYIKDEKLMAILPAPTAPIIPMVRYFSLPTEVVQPDGPRDDIHTWFVFIRDDVNVDAQGHLTVKGVPWSKPGKIVKQFDESSFLFQVNP